MLDLIYLDECGFAPSLPTGYSWCLPDWRKRVPYEYPQGRRADVLATYRPLGEFPRLAAEAFERTLTSDDLLEYLRGLPAAGVPRVVVLDNAGLHVSEAVKAQRKDLARRGIFLSYLPAHSPESNRIEEMFSKVEGAMRSAAARTKQAVHAAFGSALHDVTPEGIRAGSDTVRRMQCKPETLSRPRGPAPPRGAIGLGKSGPE